MIDEEERKKEDSIAKNKLGGKKMAGKKWARKRMVENKFGGNAFWESGVGRPDLILKDLYTIFNEPQVDVNQLQFYTAIP